MAILLRWYDRNPGITRGRSSGGAGRPVLMEDFDIRHAAPPRRTRHRTMAKNTPPPTVATAPSISAVAATPLAALGHADLVRMKEERRTPPPSAARPPLRCRARASPNCPASAPALDSIGIDAETIRSAETETDVVTLSPSGIDIPIRKPRVLFGR